MLQKSAVLLLNMGGPNQISEVEIFLKNMFADPKILQMNGLFRRILGGVIVKTRLEKSKKMYEKIGGKSPMVEITSRLVQKLQAKDDQKFYTYAMRYTPPFCEDVLRDMQQKNIQKIALFSMYPHHSSTTTMSVFTAVNDAFKKLNFSPDIKIIDRYYDDERYLNIIAKAIEEKLQSDAQNYTLIFSAHSIPKSIVQNGDLYQKHVEENVEAMKKIFAKKNMKFGEILLSYQSKIGPTKWLDPSTQRVMANVMGKNIIVYPLGFTVDNIETVYEISVLYKDMAMKNGALSFAACTCMNDSDDFVNFIYDMTR